MAILCPSDDDLMVRLAATAAGLRIAGRRAWPQLRYADVTFADRGEMFLPSLAAPLIIAAPLDSVANITFVRTGAAPGRYAWPMNHRAIFVTLDASIVAAAAMETRLRSPFGSERPSSIVTRDHVCTHLLQVLTEEARVPMHAAQALLVESVASALAVRLLAQFASMPAAARRPAADSAGGLTGRRFARVQDYIDQHLGDAITLKDLAQAAGVSRFHFARQFRARTGESPMGYLQRTRVERAKTLLRDSRTRVIDISAELGFADQSHFARTFRRLVGMPPSAYARVITSKGAIA